MNGDQELETYRRMQCIRQLDAVAGKLCLAEKVPRGVSRCGVGRETAVVGVYMALRGDHYVTEIHRSNCHPIGKGAGLSALAAELVSGVRGVCQGHGGSMQPADCSVGISGESGCISLMGGAALRAGVRGSHQVSGVFWLGASSQGAFHEKTNISAVYGSFR